MLMYTKHMFAVITLACLLAGCQGTMVTVTDEAAFDAMALRTAPALKSRNILDENGEYLTTLIPGLGDELPTDAGQRLFDRLSPAFRFRNTEPSMLPTTFAHAKAVGDTVHIAPTNFVLNQGDARVRVSLLGLTKAEGSQTPSWLVQCTVTPQQRNEERTYYLVIENPDAVVYLPTLLAVYDCFEGRCVTYFADTIQSAPPVEDAVVDLLPGQQDITAPPRQ
jgi:hypothetical protein